MAAILCVVAVLQLGTACGFPQPADVPADTDAMPSCTANEFVACEANLAQVCNATGDGTSTVDCGAAGCNAAAKRCNQCVPSSDTCSASANEIVHCGSDGLPAHQDACLLGCAAAPSAHCAYIEPRYLPDICDALATLPDFTISNSASLDTALDTNCTGGVVPQDGAPEICVVRYGKITITATGTLTIFGNRAVALVADSAVTIHGVLDVSAKGNVSGPGGGTVISGDRVSSNGGGGAGFATAGGAGGSATMDGGGGLGGARATDPSLLTVLVGGTRSARGVIGAPNSGGGGGAVTLIACRGPVSVGGMIDSGGGGGEGGKFGQSVLVTFAGTGGGTGGNVVLQGASISVTGQVFGNGGGGGAGLLTDGQGGGQPGLPGANGTRSATEGAPGGPGNGGRGAGGTGGRQGGPPGVGLHPSSLLALPGGGGGSVGFFQTYTPMGVTPMLAPTVASPAFSPNKVIKKR